MKTSGTIIVVEENPLFPSQKGVIVNSIEPDEVGFLDSQYNQWTVYPDFWNLDWTKGIRHAARERMCMS